MTSKHQENQYLESLKRILNEGEVRSNRTNIKTLSIFGERFVFDISTSFPLLTTKKVFYKLILKELLFFISGKTDTKILEDQAVFIWKGNTSKAFLEKRGLKYQEGDMGAGYGFQWRHWGAEYKDCNSDYTNKGIDQLQNIIKEIKINPFSRRLILSAWNVDQLDQMTLPPCHCFVQFYVSNDQKYLDCQLYQRSADMFLGVPFNIASYSFLTYMIAFLTGLKPRRLIHVIGDAHIYTNHIEQVKTQIKRTPYEWSQVKLIDTQKIKSIDDFRVENFKIENYKYHPSIKASMVV